MKNADMPAMPATVRGYDSDGNTVEKIGGGLTKREHFAAIAMKGLLSSETRSYQTVAEASIMYADALLAELEKTK